MNPKHQMAAAALMIAALEGDMKGKGPQQPVLRIRHGQSSKYYPPSLLCRIRHAKSERELDALLTEGSGAKYADASEQTRRKWFSAAAYRTVELQQSK